MTRYELWWSSLSAAEQQVANYYGLRGDPPGLPDPAPAIAFQVRYFGWRYFLRGGGE